jgi:hypothetical protein
VHGGHQALDNAEVVVNDLGQGGQAVGGAAGVRHDLHGGVVGVLVDAHHEHGGVGGGGGHHHLLGTSLEFKIAKYKSKEQQKLTAILC